MKSLYDEPVYQECVSRIGKLSADSQAVWGKMSVGQMLAHCANILETYCGDREIKPNIIARLLKGMVRKAVVGEKPYRHNTPTAPEFVVTDPKDFAEQRARLSSVLERFHSEEHAEALKRVHPLFGQLTLEERGWSMYKHLDHHLRQFGV